MKKIKRIASFTLFSNNFKSKLTTAYSFLPADQIQQKLRQKWKNLSPEEKKRYYKDVVCPVKNVAATKKKTGEKTQGQKTTPRKAQKDEHIGLKELTLFDDDLDLKYVSASQKRSPDDVFSLDKVDKFYVDIEKSQKTYQSSRNNVEKPVPMVIDETPFGQQGILKKSRSDQRKKRKVQFDFSAELHVNASHEQLCEDDFNLSSSDEEINTEEMTTETSKNEDVTSKGIKQILNCGSNCDLSQSNEDGIKNITLEYKAKPNPDLSTEIEPLTPQLQKNSSLIIIEKMCQAPKKKAIKGDCTEIEKNGHNGKKIAKALSLGNRSKKKGKSTSQRKDSSGPPSDDLQFEDEELKTVFTDSGKRNTSVADLKMLNTTQTNSYRSDDVSRSPSPFSDSEFHLNDSDENVDTSIGWELSDMLSSNKNSSTIENTIQLLKKSVSSSLTSTVCKSPDHFVSDCSSPLSDFSEFSDAELEMSDVSSDDEMMSDEFISDEKPYPLAGVTSRGDFNKVRKEKKDQNESEDLLCDLFDDKHSVLTRILPPPGNNGDKIAPSIFEDGSIFA